MTVESKVFGLASTFERSTETEASSKRGQNEMKQLDTARRCGKSSGNIAGNSVPLRAATPKLC